VQLHTKAKFEIADFSNKRLACLDLIINSLDQDRDDPTDLSGGWCEAGSVAHFTHLYHQGLDIHMDIQVTSVFVVDWVHELWFRLSLPLQLHAACTLHMQVEATLPVSGCLHPVLHALNPVLRIFLAGL
jgi:hypothetical protein